MKRRPWNAFAWTKRELKEMKLVDKVAAIIQKSPSQLAKEYHTTITTMEKQLRKFSSWLDEDIEHGRLGDYPCSYTGVLVIVLCCKIVERDNFFFQVSDDDTIIFAGRYSEEVLAFAEQTLSCDRR